MSEPEPRATSNNLEETIRHNLAWLDQTMRKLASYNTETCPECGELGNPRLIATWGHCVQCHNQQFRAMTT